LQPFCDIKALTLQNGRNNAPQYGQSDLLEINDAGSYSKHCISTRDEMCT